MKKYSFVTESLVQWIIKNVDFKQQKEALSYGIQLIIENVSKIIIILFLFLLLGKGFEAGLILFCFCTLRSQAGGYHCKTNFGCFIGMFLIVAICILLNVLMQTSLGIYICILIADLIILYRYSPSLTQLSFVISDDINIIKKRNSLIITVIAGITGFILFEYYKDYILYSITIEAVTLYLNKKGLIK